MRKGVLSKMMPLFAFGVISICLGILVLWPMAFFSKDKPSRVAYFEGAKYAMGIGYASLVLAFLPVFFM